MATKSHEFTLHLEIKFKFGKFKNCSVADVKRHSIHNSRGPALFPANLLQSTIFPAEMCAVNRLPCFTMYRSRFHLIFGLFPWNIINHYLLELKIEFIYLWLQLGALSFLSMTSMVTLVNVLCRVSLFAAEILMT